VRRDSDALLVERAVDAGCQFEPGVAVRGVCVSETAGARTVTGVVVGGRRRGELAIPAPITIAADGRHSTIAFGLGLAQHPPSPRRWAIGAYFEHFGPPPECVAHATLVPGPCHPGATHPPELVVGEMHIRAGRYIGVAPVPGGLTNVCLVKPSRPADPELADPTALLLNELARDPLLADRAAAARLAVPPVVLGPLA